MEIIKKYLKNIGWILIASILLGVTGELAEDIFWTNHEAIAITMRLFESIVIIVFNIMIIRKVSENTEKTIKIKTYLKAIAVTIITALITWLVAYVLVQFKMTIGNIFIWAILTILAYILKVVLSFAIYIVVLEDEKGIIDSIKESVKIATKKDNILKITLYNIVFLIILLLADLTIDIMDNLICIATTEMITYFVFIANQCLYLKLKDRKNDLSK